MADTHVSQAGTGDDSGSDALNTAPMTSLAGLWASITAGTDVLYFHGTITTQVAIGKSGTSGNLLEIDGATYSAVYASTDTQAMRTNSNNYILLNGGEFTGGTDYQFYPFGSTAGIHVQNILFNPVAAMNDCIRFHVGSSAITDCSVTGCTFNWITGMAGDTTAVRLNYAGGTTTAAIMNGFTFSNNTGSLPFRTVYFTKSNAYTDGRLTKNMTIKDNTLTNTPSAALNVSGCSGAADSYSVVSGNVLTDCGITSTGVKGELVNVIQASYNLQMVIEHNTVTGAMSSATGGDGHSIIIDHFDTVNSSDNITIRYNTCTGALEKPNSSGLNIFRGSNCSVYGNNFSGNNNGAIIQNSTSTGCVFYNNLLKDNVKFGGKSDNAAAASTWKNNIFDGNDVGLGATTSSSPTLPTESNNCYFNNTVDYDDGGTPQTIDSTSIASDPLLDSNYIPDISSPCYHAGTTVAFNLKDYKGHKFNNPPTIGAYEFTSRSVAKAGRNWR